MNSIFKNLFFTITFNTCMFLLLIIGIQNNSNKRKINFLVNETINLPVGFIIGTSFISGSIFGSFITQTFDQKKDIKNLK